jgi:exodeoxyribonuclease-3
LKIITWNINSIRIRLQQLSEIISEFDPDVICLQETKCEDDKFPLKDIQELGFKYVAINGQPSYNGVAI